MKLKRLLVKTAASGFLLWFVGLYFVTPYFVEATPSASYVGSFAPYDREFTLATYSVATDPRNGDIYLAGGNQNSLFTIYQFHADGTYVAEFTDDLIKFLQSSPPMYRLAITPNGKLYIDGYDFSTNNFKIVVFDLATRTKVASFGSTGTGDGQFSTIRDLAYSTFNNDVYVISDLNRVQIFDESGNFISKFGSAGSGDGQFNTPSAIAVSPTDGNVYVMDNGNHRVQVFDKDGNFLRKWGSFGTADGQFGTYVPSIEVDGSDNIYVLDSNGQNANKRVQVFTNQGVFVTKFGTSGDADGQFNNSKDLAFSPSYDKIYIAEHTTLTNARVQIFDASTHAYQSKLVYTHIPAPGTISYAEGSAQDANGNIYIADSERNIITKFDSSDAFVKSWGSQGTGDGEFDYPTAVAVSPFNQHVYVFDSGSNRIEVFDTDGNYLSQFGGSGSGDGQFNYAEALTIDTAGNLYVADSNNNRIQVFAADGTFLRKWDTDGASGQLSYPSSILYSPINQYVYVYDSGSSVILKYDTLGNYISSFGSYGTGTGQFRYVEGMDVDAQGNLYVVDSGTYRMEVFTKDGTFISTWGTRGDGDMQFDYPLGVINKGDYVYVIDDLGIKKYLLDLSALPPVITTSSSVQKSLSSVAGTAEANASITVTESGSTICTTTAGGSGNWTCTLSSPITLVGDHVISAVQTDSSGNVSDEATKTITVTASSNRSGSVPTGGGSGSGVNLNQNPITQPVTTPVTPVTPPVDTSCGAQFTQKLRKGSFGNEVVKVQQFLASRGFFAARATGYYGTITTSAVKAFQTAYYKEILVPLHLTKATGIWSYATIGLANNLLCEKQ